MTTLPGHKACETRAVCPGSSFRPDNHYSGTLRQSPMSEQELSVEKGNVVTKQLPIGEHSYSAKLYERSGNVSRLWKSRFSIESKNINIKLSSSDLNN